MKSRIEVIRKSSPATTIIVAAVLWGLCGYFTVPARADGGQGSQSLAQGRRDMLVGHYRHAMRRFRQAAAKGNGEAMYTIGVLYGQGNGVPQDYAKAMTWCRKAAAKGNGEAMNAIGALYDHGDGVAQDYAKAMAWWRKAAAEGNDSAMFNIGTLYDRGDGVPQDEKKAVMWMRRAELAGGQAAVLARKTIAQIKGK